MSGNPAGGILGFINQGKILFLIVILSMTQAYAAKRESLFHKKDLYAFSLKKSDQSLAKNIDDLVTDLKNNHVNLATINATKKQVSRSKVYESFKPWVHNLHGITFSKSLNQYKKNCVTGLSEVVVPQHFSFLKQYSGRFCHDKLFKKASAYRSFKSGHLMTQLLDQATRNLIYSNEISRLVDYIGMYSEKSAAYKFLSKVVTDYYIANKKVPPQALLATIYISSALTRYIQKTGLEIKVTHEKFKELRDHKNQILTSLREMHSNKHLNKSIDELFDFYAEHKDDFNKTKAWSNLYYTAKNLSSYRKFDHSYRVYKFLYRNVPPARNDDTAFGLIWTQISQNKFNSAINIFEDYKQNKKLENIGEKLIFWTGVAHLRLDEETKARKYFDALITINPLSFYSIVSAKKVNRFFPEGYTGNPLIANLDSRKTIVPLPIKNFKPEFINELKAFKIFTNFNSDHFVEPMMNYLIDKDPLQMVKSRTHLKNATSQKVMGSVALFMIKELMDSNEHLKTFIVTFKSLHRKHIQLTPEVLMAIFPQHYKQTISSYAKGIDPSLFLSLIRQESAFDPKAISRVGAVGLMQLMPRTARSVANKKIRHSRLKHPQTNIKLGIKHFKHLMKRYEGNILLSLAAYNAGESNVKRWRKNTFNEDDVLQMIEAIPFRETNKYVKLIVRNFFFYKYLYGKQKEDPQVDKLLGLTTSI